MKFMTLALLPFAPSLSAHLWAQTPVPTVPVFPAPCSTWFVDPVNGANTNPGTLFMPFATLTFAVGVAAASPGPDTIVLLPGEYNDVNETYPILMPPDVSIQGTSALNTVLIARSGGVPSVLRFEPSTPTAFDQAVVDGVTIVGHRRCIEIWDATVAGFRVRSNPTIANCIILDSIVAAVDIVVSDEAPPFPGHDADGNGWVENRPKLINCTIAVSRIGVLDQLVSAAGFASWGESEIGMLNCLLSDNPLTDLEGVDSLDVITSAFDLADGAGLSPVKAGRVVPLPVFSPGATPPLYVETTLGLALMPFDLRVIPGSPAIDAGSLPALVWPNLTTGQQFFPCTVDIFDADCEGYGNPRIARGGIDIGADESGELIVAGYQRGTTDFNLGANAPLPPNASPIAPPSIWVYVNPDPAFAAGLPYDGLCAMNSIGPVPGIGFWLPWFPPAIQGVRGLRTVPPTTIPGIGGTLWMDLNPPQASFTLNFTAPPVPVGIPIVAGPILQLNMQTLPIEPVSGTLSDLTNLQTFFRTP